MERICFGCTTFCLRSSHKFCSEFNMLYRGFIPSMDRGTGFCDCPADVLTGVPLFFLLTLFSLAIVSQTSCLRSSCDMAVCSRLLEFSKVLFQFPIVSLYSKQTRRYGDMQQVARILKSVLCGVLYSQYTRALTFENVVSAGCAQARPAHSGPGRPR